MNPPGAGDWASMCEEKSETARAVRPISKHATRTEEWRGMATSTASAKAAIVPIAMPTTKEAA
jgi:hypothetical protein